jgi:hypothetical protein
MGVQLIVDAADPAHGRCGRKNSIQLGGQDRTAQRDVPIVGVDLDRTRM